MLMKIVNNVSKYFRARRELAEMQQAYHELRSSILSIEPYGAAYTLKTVWKATKDRPFYGQFVDHHGQFVDGKEAHFDHGFVYGQAKGKFWVGDELTTIYAALANFDLRVTSADIGDLLKDGVDEVFFRDGWYDPDEVRSATEAVAEMATKLGIKRRNWEMLESHGLPATPQPGDVVVTYLDWDIEFYAPQDFVHYYEMAPAMAQAA